MRNSTKMPTNFSLIFASAIVIFALCAPSALASSANTATVALHANPSIGYTWELKSISPEGVVRQASLSIKSPTDEKGLPPSGAGSSLVFTFEAVTAGEADIVFSKKLFRDIPGHDEPTTVVYRATADDKGGLTLIRLQDETKVLPQKPAGFIALSESGMTWADAKAWCEQRGGRLPLTGTKDGSSGISGVPIDGFNGIFPGVPIDGFGTLGAPWPAGLPIGGLYWTGVENRGTPGASWFVRRFNGKVGARSADQGNIRRAACVPK